MIGLNFNKEQTVNENPSTELDSVNLKLIENAEMNTNNVNDKKNNVKESSPTQMPAESPLIRTEQIFQKMDLDKNGVISEHEFINGCLQDKFLYQMLTADYSDSF